MARIPVVQEPSVRTEGLPTPYARPFATPQGQGADFGNVLEGAAHVLAQREQQAREKADSASIQGAWGQAQDALNKTILDPEKGYSSLRGADAMAGREKALGTYNKALDGINEKLTPDQQRMFEPHLRAIREQGYTHVISHEAQQQENYSVAQFKGNVDSTMETMQMPQIVADQDQLKTSVSKLFQAGIDEGKRRYGTDASKEAIQSVVDPMLQQAALGGMQAALTQAEQSGDPTIAKNAFDVLGKYLLKNHQKQVSGMVEALSAKAAIAQASRGAVGAAVDSVVVPGGQAVAHVDETRFAKALADLPSDAKHAPEIEKAAQTQKANLDRVWNGVTGSVYKRIESLAMAGGGFDLGRASALDKEWLRVNDPDAMRKLEKEEDRGDKTERALASSEAWSALAADVAAHPDVYKEMSAPEFTKLSVDQGVGALDRIKALKLFQDVQKAGQSEKINKTVSEQLLDAFPGPTGSANGKRREKLQGMLLDAASDYADRWKGDTEGKVVPTIKLREFIDAELVKGKVRGSSGRFWPDDAATRIEYQRNEKYRGLSFEPTDPTIAAIPQTPPRPARTDVAGFDALNRPPEEAPPVQAATPAAIPDQLPVSIRATPPAPQFWRYTKDRSKRYPTDEKGNIIGSAEAAK